MFNIPGASLCVDLILALQIKFFGSIELSSQLILLKFRYLKVKGLILEVLVVFKLKLENLELLEILLIINLLN